MSQSLRLESLALLIDSAPGVTDEDLSAIYMRRLLKHPFVVEWLPLGQEQVDVIPALEVGS
jgi:hypothetical protein